MSDARHIVGQFDDDDDEDIFRAAFSATNAAGGATNGKVKIDTNQTSNDSNGKQIPSPANFGMEKTDPSKENEENNFQRDNKFTRAVSQDNKTAYLPENYNVMRKANSVDTGPRNASDNYYSSPEEYEEDEDSDKFIEIQISEPTRIGEGMSSFLAYRVTTRTNMSLFKLRDFEVLRRFSDFLGLHEKLFEKYARRGRIIPPAPEKSLVGTTKVKMAAEENLSGEKAEFIARRRLALQRFINRLAQHPVLRRDPIFIEFVATKRDLPRATSTSALSSASVFRLLGRVGDTVNKMTYKMEETDPWYEEKMAQIDSLESQLKKLYTIAENLQTCRHDLAAATGAFSQSTAALSSVEEAHTLSRALAHLSRVEEKVEQVHRSQAEADTFYLFDLFKDYVALIGAIREALNERNKAFQAAQHAQSMVIKKKEQKARLEMGGRTDKLPMANEDVVDWENRLEDAQANFVKVSKVIKVEIDFFERYRVRDFKNAILLYLESLMESQVQLVRHWEEFLPEVKNSLY